MYGRERNVSCGDSECVVKVQLLNYRNIPLWELLSGLELSGLHVAPCLRPLARRARIHHRVHVFTGRERGKLQRGEPGQGARFTAERFRRKRGALRDGVQVALRGRSDGASVVLSGRRVRDCRRVRRRCPSLEGRSPRR